MFYNNFIDLGSVFCTWLTAESSVLNLFPTATTANNVGILPLYNHTVVTTLQKWLEVSTPNCQTRNYQHEYESN